MAKKGELELQFLREKIRFDNYGEINGPTTAILACQDRDGKPVAVKVECEEEDLAAGICYRFFGSWTESKHGPQFWAKTFVRSMPFGRSGVVAYLRQAQGVGTVTANLIFDTFQGDGIRLLREEPEVIGAINGIRLSGDKLMKASADLKRMAKNEGATVELLELLDGRGFPKNLIKRLLREFKNKAAERVKADPWLLLSFPGCGFVKTDQLYLDLGHDPADIVRQAYCALYALITDRGGHTWMPPRVVEDGLQKRISANLCQPVAAVKKAIEMGIVAKHRDATHNHLWLAVGRRARNEARVAESVAKLLRSPPNWPDVGSLDGVSDHQAEAAAIATSSPISILTGGPGTGKTYTAAQIIKALGGKDGGVIAAAPTGKAAVRIAEVMEGYGIDCGARTIHGLLGVVSHSENGGWEFEHNEGEPLPFRLVVVDEASMIDTDLMASLLSAIGPGTHVMFIGDVGQLPPVGHGAPLRDFIEYGVPVGELTEFRRNSGDIVKACHAIRDGKPFQWSEKWDPPNGFNLRLLRTVTPEASIGKTVTAIKRIGNAAIADPVWGCQVICAVNDKSELARKKLNAILQAELNPSGKRCEPNPFRVGDKIVCLKNASFPCVPDAPDGFNVGKSEDGTVRVANGEQAAVKVVEAKRTIAQLDAPNRLIVIPRGVPKDGETGGGGDWDLAYAISCHKSQGSEWPVVFVILDEYPGARMVCSREWLFTAKSRAKLACLCVGREETAMAMIKRQAINDRRTFLPFFINESLSYMRTDRTPEDFTDQAERAAQVAVADAEPPSADTNAETADTKPRSADIEDLGVPRLAASQIVEHAERQDALRLTDERDQ